MTDFRREIQWKPGFDHRNDADPKKRQYGCHGLEVRWLLHGPNATIQFLFMTPWLPTWDDRTTRDLAFSVLPADLGYHADKPQYEGQKGRACDCRPDKRCFYDGSGLAADDVFKLLISKGEEAVWEHMREYYDNYFATEKAA